MSESSSVNSPGDAAPIRVSRGFAPIEGPDAIRVDQLVTLLNSERDDRPEPVPWVGRDGEPINVRVRVPTDERGQHQHPRSPTAAHALTTMSDVNT